MKTKWDNGKFRLHSHRDFFSKAIQATSMCSWHSFTLSLSYSVSPWRKWTSYPLWGGKWGTDIENATNIHDTSHFMDERLRSEMEKTTMESGQCPHHCSQSPLFLPCSGQHTQYWVMYSWDQTNQLFPRDLRTALEALGSNISKFLGQRKT